MRSVCRACHKTSSASARQPQLLSQKFPICVPAQRLCPSAFHLVPNHYPFIAKLWLFPLSQRLWRIQTSRKFSAQTLLRRLSHDLNRQSAGTPAALTYTSADTSRSYSTAWRLSPKTLNPRCRLTRSQYLLVLMKMPLAQSPPPSTPTRSVQFLTTRKTST